MEKPKGFIVAEEAASHAATARMQASLWASLPLMLEMAEALKLVSEDLINSDLGGLAEAREAYRKWEEWK